MVKMNRLLNSLKSARKHFEETMTNVNAICEAHMLTMDRICFFYTNRATGRREYIKAHTINLIDMDRVQINARIRLNEKTCEAREKYIKEVNEAQANVRSSVWFYNDKTNQRVL